MPDYPPLLAPGFVDVTLDDLDRLFVERFTDRAVRQDLVEHLRRFLAVLRSLGITGMMWLDGSFVTEKPHPGDIDAVLLVANAVLGALPRTDLDTFRQIIDNKRDIKLRYKCDLYFCDPDSAEWRAYWRGWFGFNRGEEVKGIARLTI
jgi:uncharacterized protein DUF6932